MYHFANIGSTTLITVKDGHASVDESVSFFKQDFAGTDSVAKSAKSVGKTSYGKLSSFSPKPDTTRINLANGRTRFTPLRQSGKPVSAGMNHVINQHFNRPLVNINEL